MESYSLLLRLVLSQSDCEVLNRSLELECIETLLKGLEDIFEDLGANIVDLVKTFYSVLHDLSNGDDFVHSVAHRSEGDLGGVTFTELRENVGHVVAKRFVFSDAHLIIWGLFGSVPHLAILFSHLYQPKDILSLFYLLITIIL